MLHTGDEKMPHALVGKKKIQIFKIKENLWKLVISWSALKAISIMKIHTLFLK